MRFSNKGRLGETYNIGGCNEWTNIDIVRLICERLDELRPGEKSKSELITYVKDRAGHDRRYAIDATRIMNETRLEAGLYLRDRHRADHPLVPGQRGLVGAHQGWCVPGLL